ncbi:DUF1127 domain-containing protein [Phreatobacter aquaticus]|nr:DUF1127 domain-containing protein [Phreatobacter aquaticus]
MTTLTTSAFPATLDAGKASPSLTKAISAIVGPIAAYMRTRRNLRELEGLSEEALKDIGLSRSDLPRVARWGH